MIRAAVACTVESFILPSQPAGSGPRGSSVDIFSSFCFLLRLFHWINLPLCQTNKVVILLVFSLLIMSNRRINDWQLAQNEQLLPISPGAPGKTPPKANPTSSETASFLTPPPPSRPVLGSCPPWGGMDIFWNYTIWIDRYQRETYFQLNVAKNCTMAQQGICNSQIGSFVTGMKRWRIVTSSAKNDIQFYFLYARRHALDWTFTKARLLSCKESIILYRASGEPSELLQLKEIWSSFNPGVKIRHKSRL